MTIDTRLVLVTGEPLNVMLTFCCELPDVRVTRLGLAARPNVLPTARVTGKLNDAPVVVLTKTIPVKVPERPLLFAFTCTKPATPGFEAESQFCPEVTDTVLIVGATLFSRMLTFRVENVDPVGLKATGFGVQVKPPVPELRTVKLTCSAPEVAAWPAVVSTIEILPVYVVPATSWDVDRAGVQAAPTATVTTLPLTVAHSQLV